MLKLDRYDVHFIKDYRAEAEFLLSKTRARPASPPLTADEFYRQQKMLHQFLVYVCVCVLYVCVCVVGVCLCVSVFIIFRL